MAGSHTPQSLMIRKLESIFPLDDDERRTLEALPVQVVDVDADRDIVRIGDRPTQACLLVAGYVFGYKLTGDGRRQIVGLHVPGDIPDLQSLHLKVLDVSIATLTPSTVGFLQHSDLRRACERHPRITAALWRETLVDASIAREWLLNIGGRSATTRMAHLLCEFMARLQAVGLATEDSFDLPITQLELADVVGTSTVHVNRVLQSLRADGLIQTRGTQVTIPDWEKLKAAGEFDPVYLHLVKDDAA